MLPDVFVDPRMERNGPVACFERGQNKKIKEGYKSWKVMISEQELRHSSHHHHCPIHDAITHTTWMSIKKIDR